MLARFSFFILLLLSVLFLPLWASVILAITGMLHFSIFWEAIALFFVSDLLYGTGEAKFFNFLFVSTLAGAVSLIFIEMAKKKLKFYKNKDV